MILYLGLRLCDVEWTSEHRNFGVRLFDNRRFHVSLENEALHNFRGVDGRPLSIKTN